MGKFHPKENVQIKEIVSTDSFTLSRSLATDIRYIFSVFRAKNVIHFGSASGNN